MITQVKLYNVVSDPFARYLPENCLYCTSEQIDKLHRNTCKILKISDIYPDILWSFVKNWRNTLGEADYWEDEAKKMQWRIRYCSKSWLEIGKAGRRNTIIHEVCHLGVERLYGHKPNPRNGNVCLKDHGEHWQGLMHKCKEDPDMVIKWNYK